MPGTSFNVEAESETQGEAKMPHRRLHGKEQA